jgi:hypothetical protein
MTAPMIEVEITIGTPQWDELTARRAALLESTMTRGDNDPSHAVHLFNLATSLFLHFHHLTAQNQAGEPVVVVNRV